METEEIAAFFDRVADDYVERHLAATDAGMEGKATIAAHLPEDVKRILDIGAGSGLELEEVYRRFPRVQVTAVDISQGMLEHLRERFPDRDIKIVAGDYFTADFGSEPYDAVITSMSLHHWKPDEKRRLYPRFFEVLKPGGTYIENDYMLAEGKPADLAAEEARLLAEREELDRENPGMTHVHFDLPATVPSEMQRLREAGFADVQEVWQSGNNATLVAKRPEDQQS